MTLGEKLKNILMDKSISVSELARISGIPKTTIYSIISRESKSARYDVVAKLAKALDINIIDLYDTEELVEEANQAMHNLLGAVRDVSIDFIPTDTHSEMNLRAEPERIYTINKALEKDGILLEIQDDGEVCLKNIQHENIACVFSDGELKELYESIDSQIRMAVTKFILDKQIIWLFDIKPESLQSPVDNPNMDSPKLSGDQPKN
ncbi:MAG: helix-turn-helix transcriptional regulator [Anaerotignum propionicum]|uniref:helix-turn-helix domain-containing protein n=1 Tax=Anaerotignum propionicum TaxID=28446 RepID=UPI002B20E6C7|nr:helix-turn-helix transcriptional regulator [Anaerotignum propionicum]MEA5058044.1 helix-turn-helix transcriptional regulator [Anaerotignum propionicum]